MVFFCHNSCNYLQTGFFSSPYPSTPFSPPTHLVKSPNRSQSDLLNALFMSYYCLRNCQWFPSNRINCRSPTPAQVYDLILHLRAFVLGTSSAWNPSPCSRSFHQRGLPIVSKIAKFLFSFPFISLYLFSFSFWH